ncbi:MAG: hypothetical protein ACERKD_23375 [Prolixibacteraceae bacterium]
MKNIPIISYAVLGIVLLFSSCEKAVDDPSANFATFITNNEGEISTEIYEGEVLTVAVNQEVYFKFKGEADKISIWTGDSISAISHDFEKYVESGYNVKRYSGVYLSTSNESYDYKYTYGQPGKYQVYMVANNISPTGAEIVRKTASATISVEDLNGLYTRFKSFSILQLGALYGSNEFVGVLNENTVDIDIPGAADLSRIISKFEVFSGTKVYLNGKEQISGLTTNDFSQEIVYTLVSTDGNTGEVLINKSELPLNTEAKLLTYSLPELGITGEIDAETGNVLLEFPPGTDMSKQYIAEFSNSLFSRVRLGRIPQKSNVTANLYQDTLHYNVTAEDGVSISNYQVIPVLNPTIKSARISNLNPKIEGEIDAIGNVIKFGVLAATDLTALQLTIDYSPADAVVKVIKENNKVLNKSFVNGVTTLDFNKPITLKLTDTKGLESIYQLVIELK